MLFHRLSVGPVGMRVVFCNEKSTARIDIECESVVLCCNGNILWWGKQWCFQHVSTVKLHPHIQRNQFQDIRCAAIRWLPKRNAAKVCSTRGAFSACGTWMPPVKVVNYFPLQNSVEFGISHCHVWLPESRLHSECPHYTQGVDISL